MGISIHGNSFNLAKRINNESKFVGKGTYSMPAEVPQFKDGGLIRGPGTGKSDSIDTELPAGAFIIPAEVVKAYGADALQALVDAHRNKVPAQVSNGEFEVPPDVVQKTGADYWNRLVESVTGKGARAQKGANGGVKAAEGYDPDTDAPLTGNPSPKPQGIFNGLPDYGYGNRYQAPGDTNPARPKGTGFYGEIKRPDGGYSTELSTDTGRGEEPTLVPGLTAGEVRSVVSAKDGEAFPDSVYKKADSHAAFRQLNGRSPFAGINDKQELLPVDHDNIVSNALAHPNDPPYKGVQGFANGGLVTHPNEANMQMDNTANVAKQHVAAMGGATNTSATPGAMEKASTAMADKTGGIFKNAAAMVKKQSFAGGGEVQGPDWGSDPEKFDTLQRAKAAVSQPKTHGFGPNESPTFEPTPARSVDAPNLKPGYEPRSKLSLAENGSKPPFEMKAFEPPKTPGTDLVPAGDRVVKSGEGILSRRTGPGTGFTLGETNSPAPRTMQKYGELVPVGEKTVRPNFTMEPNTNPGGTMQANRALVTTPQAPQPQGVGAGYDFTGPQPERVATSKEGAAFKAQQNAQGPTARNAGIFKPGSFEDYMFNTRGKTTFSSDAGLAPAMAIQQSESHQGQLEEARKRIQEKFPNANVAAVPGQPGFAHEASDAFGKAVEALTPVPELVKHQRGGSKTPEGVAQKAAASAPQTEDQAFNKQTENLYDQGKLPAYVKGEIDHEGNARTPAAASAEAQGIFKQPDTTVRNIHGEDVNGALDENGFFTVKGDKGATAKVLAWDHSDPEELSHTLSADRFGQVMAQKRSMKDQREIAEPGTASSEQYDANGRLRASSSHNSGFKPEVQGYAAENNGRDDATALGYAKLAQDRELADDKLGREARLKTDLGSAWSQYTQPPPEGMEKNDPAGYQKYLSRKNAIRNWLLVHDKDNVIKFDKTAGF